MLPAPRSPLPRLDEDDRRDALSYVGNRRRRRIRSVVLWSFGLLVLSAAFYYFRSPILCFVAKTWIINEPLGKADIIVVLGGGLETRPFAAAKLYREGYAPRVLIARPKSSPTDDLGLTTRETDITRQILLKEGVPDTAIVEFGNDVRSTYDEALALRAWVLQEPSAKASVVSGPVVSSPVVSSPVVSSPLVSGPLLSSPLVSGPLVSGPLVSSPLLSSPLVSVIIPTDIFHTRRVRWLFRKQLKSTGAQVTVDAVPVREYTQTNWWRHEQGLVAFQNEVLKSIYYHVKY